MKCVNRKCGDYTKSMPNNCFAYPNVEHCERHKPLKAKTEPVAKLQFERGVISPEQIKEQLDRLLSVVNAVTCPHRHGTKIRPKDLTRLCNRQVEVEEALREMGL